MRKLYTQVFIFSSLAVFSLLFHACRNDLDELTPGAGSLSFSQFITLGDEYVAGYANWGLYAFSQENSFPNLLSQQFRLVKEISFRQPVLPENGTGFQELSSLSASICPEKASIPSFRFSTPAAGWESNISTQGPFHNLGIPQLPLAQLNDTSLSEQNPFFSRISQTTDRSYLQEVQRLDADLCITWLGSQALLDFVSQDGLEIEEGISPQDFRTTYKTLLDSILTHTSANVLVADIPPILSFPYFNSVPATFFPEDDCQSRGLPIYITTLSETGEEVSRVATIRDHILLPALNEIGTFQNGVRMGLDFQLPLPDRWVMDEEEANILQERLSAYNDAISNMVSEVNADFQRQRVYQVPLQSAFSELERGTTEDGIELNNQYINGGVFSLDGLYFTPRGNAFAANIFIEYMNATFSASIPLISLADYPAVFFP